MSTCTWAPLRTRGRARTGISTRLLLSFTLGVFLALFSPHTSTGASAQAGGVAIVVHPDAPVEDLTMDQLRRIFLAEQQFWSSGIRVTLLVRAPEAYERDIVLNHIYRMDEDRFRQYWVAKIFRAEIPAGPKIVYSSDMAKELVSVIPGAITFMPASAVDASVRVVRIEGNLPDEDGYILR